MSVSLHTESVPWLPPGVAQQVGWRPRRPGWLAGRAEPVAVLGLYLLVAILYFGRFALGSPSGGTIGAGPDVQVFLWGFRWWPFALGHGLDPFISHVVWHPFGSDILWTTTVPGLSLLTAPLTLIAGPALTWNLLCVLAPTLSAWTAYLLCRELNCRVLPAVVGGMLFGFSSYQLAEGQAHLQLTMSLFVPLAAWVALRYLHGRLSERGLALRLAALAVAQFLISPEVLLTMVLMGALTLVGAFLLWPEGRARLRPLFLAGAAGLAGAGLVVSPVVLTMLRNTPAHLNASIGYSSDLLNLIVPTQVTALGDAWTIHIAHHFVGNLSEETAYLGLPLCLILVSFAIGRRSDPRARLLLFVLATGLILSLGRTLTVDGHELFWLPGAFLGQVPLLRDALPARLTLYTSLAAAVIVAVWLSDVQRWRSCVWALAALAIVFIAPATSAQMWWRPTPAGIASGKLSRLIPAGSNVISLPFWNLRDRGLYAQSAAGMRFNLADGWLQLMPSQYARATDFARELTEPGLAVLRTPARIDAFEDTLCSLRVGYVLLWNYSPRLLAGLDLTPRRAGDAAVFRMPPCTTPPARGGRELAAGADRGRPLLGPLRERTERVSHLRSAL